MQNTEPAFAAERQLWNQLKRALKGSVYFPVYRYNIDKNTGEKKAVILLYRRSGGPKAILVVKRSDLTKFVNDVKRISGITAEKWQECQDRPLPVDRPVIVNRNADSPWWQQGQYE